MVYVVTRAGVLLCVWEHEAGAQRHADLLNKLFPRGSQAKVNPMPVRQL